VVHRDDFHEIWPGAGDEGYREGGDFTHRLMRPSYEAALNGLTRVSISFPEFRMVTRSS
jgi:hypothetical protein